MSTQAINQFYDMVAEHEGKAVFSIQAVYDPKAIGNISLKCSSCMKENGTLNEAEMELIRRALIAIATDVVARHDKCQSIIDSFNRMVLRQPQEDGMIELIRNVLAEHDKETK